MDFVRRHEVKAETGVTPHLNTRERLFWIGEQIISPQVVDDMRPIL